MDTDLDYSVFLTLPPSLSLPPSLLDFLASSHQVDLG